MMTYELDDIEKRALLTAVVDRARADLNDGKPLTEMRPENSSVEQSQLFPRYSFAVVTGRYKILDNRSSRLTTNQIATADGEEEARLIVTALNQYDSLIQG